MRYGILDLIFKYSESEISSVHIDILTIVHNLIAGKEKDVYKALIKDSDLVHYVISSLGDTRMKIRLLAIEVLTDFLKFETCEKDVQSLVDQGIFQKIVELLETNKDSIDDKINAVILLKNIVRKKRSQVLGDNDFAVTFQNYGGLNIVENLATHSNYLLSKT